MKKLSYILLFLSLMFVATVCATPKVNHSNTNSLDYLTVTDSINPYTMGT